MSNDNIQKFNTLPPFLLTMVSKIRVNNKDYSSIKEWAPKIEYGENIIIINPIKYDFVKITVKESARHDSPFFQFNKLHNNNKPIPLTIMYGIPIEEDNKMIKMDLWDKEHKVHWIGWLLKSWIIKQEKIYE